MSHIAVSGLAYAHPGGELLFSDVSFRLAPGRHAGLIGVNGVGKSTLLRILARVLDGGDGDATAGGVVGYMAQDVGVSDGQLTVRELLLTLAPSALRAAGERMLVLETQLRDGDEAAGVELGSVIGDFSALGGYELEGQWDACCRRIVGAPFSELAERPARTLSGGERKQLVLELLLHSDADVLLLDEPDNFLDVPAKLELERRIRTSRKTILMISHDREVLAAAVDSIITLEGNGAWVHGGSYASYAHARSERQRRLGDAVKRWQEEERRLHDLTRTFKERAKYHDVWAKRADAMETRWKRFRDAGPPPAPVADQSIAVRIPGGDSARIVLRMRELGIDGLVVPFSDEVHYGERVAVIGPNGTGKSSLMAVLVGERDPDAGELVVGPRVVTGHFTQLQTRPDFAGRSVLEIVSARRGELRLAMAALARYGLAEAARRPFELLSGGEKARLEILILELEGANLLLLDEPTDNLDADSSEALERALESFAGTVVAISHDRTFLRRCDRFVLLDRDGAMLALPSYEAALAALTDPDRAGSVPLAKRL